MQIALTPNFITTHSPFPKPGSGPRKQRAPHRFQNNESSDSARNIVGVIHLILGAWVVAGGVFAGVFAGTFSLATMAPVALLLVVAATMAVGGVMIRDGQRRGALVLVVADGLLLIAKLAGALVTGTFNWELLLIAGMLGSVIWLWPSLPAPAKPSGV